MSRILLVTDVPWVLNDVHAALHAPDYEVEDMSAPQQVAAAMEGFDAAVVDLQVGAMGGMAITRAVRDLAELEGRRQPPVVMLLDRAADAFLARRAGASTWLAKPFTAPQLRTALAAALAVKDGDDGEPDDAAAAEQDDAAATIA